MFFRKFKNRFLKCTKKYLILIRRNNVLNILWEPHICLVLWESWSLGTVRSSLIPALTIYVIYVYYNYINSGRKTRVSTRITWIYFKYYDCERTPRFVREPRVSRITVAYTCVAARLERRCDIVHKYGEVVYTQHQSLGLRGSTGFSQIIVTPDYMVYAGEDRIARGRDYYLNWCLIICVFMYLCPRTHNCFLFNYFFCDHI